MFEKRRVDRARGERIKYVRRELLGHRAQEAFAKALSEFTGRPITRGAVGNWELGKEISLENLKAIAEMAGISLDWIAYNSGERPQKAVAPNTNDSEARLRAALRDFGVREYDLGRAVSAVKIFLDGEQRSPGTRDDQSEFSTPPRE